MKVISPIQSRSLVEPFLEGCVANETLFPPGRVSVVGVLNLTPDSFSDGGQLFRERGGVQADLLAESAQRLEAEGACVLDVGGESTRPGAAAVSVAEEMRRVEEAIFMLAEITQVRISIDTQKAEVARSALTAGASIINDVSGLATDPELADVAAETGAVLILGHMRGTPRSMQVRPAYRDVLEEVVAELERSVNRARRAGVSTDQLVVDPGIGFGKRVQDNLELLAHAGWIRGRLGLPVLVGPSRKAFIGELTGDPVNERDSATHAGCAVAAFAGADAVRVHDAGGARRAVTIGRALRDARRKDRS